MRPVAHDGPQIPVGVAHLSPNPSPSLSGTQRGQLLVTHCAGLVQGCALLSRQVPFVHVSVPAAQTLPHLPQFELSVGNETQVPLQLLWFTAQQKPLLQLPLQIMLKKVALLLLGFAPDNHYYRLR